MALKSYHRTPTVPKHSLHLFTGQTREDQGGTRAQLELGNLMDCSTVENLL
jgi:hypothetical protein